jgi:hypothetical protein
MKAVETCRWMGIELKPYVAFACEYLESHGFRFCIDFGYGNAVEKARAHWRARKRK